MLGVGLMDVDGEEVHDNLSDSSSDDDDNNNARLRGLEVLPNGRRDIRHAAVNMVVEMRGVAAMTRVGVRRAMVGAELVLQVNNMSLKQDVREFLNTVGQENNPRAQHLLAKFDSVDAFDGMKSDKGQISGMKKYFHYVEPQTMFLHHRLDQRLNGEGGAYGLVPVPNSFQFASVIEFLKMLLRKQDVMDYVRNRRPLEDGMLESYTDGNEFRDHPFFQRHPDAFQLVLYGDGVDPCRMAGPKSGIHEIYHFCIAVLNLPPAVFYSSESIFPMTMANAQDCNGTFAAVLTPFVEELRQLEAGVPVYVNGGLFTLRATLVGVKGDAKAIHEMLGFLSCGARHFCPQCMISRQELHRGDIAFGEIRTQAMSDEQLQRVRENPAYSTVCGLRCRPVLHDSAYFRAEHNNNSDLMHDGPEGIIMMLIRLCLKKFVCTDEFFTVEQLNERIIAFNYGKQNSKDKPTANFSYESLQNANTVHLQKMNAGQTLLLFRALPFILDSIGLEGVADENEHLQYLLLLSEIFQIASAPRIPRAVIPYLRRLLETFRRSWYIMFPDVNPINKFHHLMHLCDNTLRKGPQRKFWCFREEGKNCPLKRHVVICNNLQNPQKTAMEQAQIRVAKVWGTQSENVKDTRTCVKKESVFVHASPARPVLRALGFQDNDRITVCKAITVWSFGYRKGEFLLYSKASENHNGLPRFGKILSIICPDGTDHVWFALEPWCTVGLVERYNAYQVRMQENAPTHLIDVKDLPVHPAINEGVDGEAFIELTEQSLLSNFPKIVFGQRRACLKIIESILVSKNKFIFQNADHDEANEIYDLSEIKTMSSQELPHFLQKSSKISPETIIYLQDEEVDGESFLEFTEQSLIDNFPKLSKDQRMAILQLQIMISSTGISEPTFKFTNHDIIEIPLEEDLGTCILQGFVDNKGVLQPVTGASREKVDVQPCVSSSFIKKKRRKTSEAGKKKSKLDPEEVEPLKVVELLELTHEGRKVIDFVRTKKFCDIVHQKIMMRILYDHHCLDKESPLKYYPQTISKIAMAKGIVADFPCLADVGDCTWASWLEVVKTKFETIQSHLEPSKKKNQPRSTKPVTSSKTPSISSTATCSAEMHHQEPTDEECVESQKSSMNYLTPSPNNKSLISLALSQTFTSRRKWILSNKPSVTEILLEYKHLSSYEGEMISEEFRRIEKLHDDAIEKFQRNTPYILKYAQEKKPSLFEEVSNKFNNDIVIALVCLSKLLTVTLNKNTAAQDELNHVKMFKKSIESVPSSALFQVAPEGTDVDAYVSVETHPVLSEQLTPIYPYLLWITNDCRAGMVYLKFDSKSLLIGKGEDEFYLLKAFDIFVKAHHVFMVKYHPYLRTTVFDYFEHLYGIKTPVNTVARFVTALRQVALN